MLRRLSGCVFRSAGKPGPGMAAITVLKFNADVAAARQKGSNGGAAGPGKRVKHKIARL